VGNWPTLNERNRETQKEKMMDKAMIDLMKKSRDEYLEVLDLLALAQRKARACFADLTADEIDTVYNHGLDISACIQERIDEALAL